MPSLASQRSLSLYHRPRPRGSVPALGSEAGAPADGLPLAHIEASFQLRRGRVDEVRGGSRVLPLRDVTECLAVLVHCTLFVFLTLGRNFPRLRKKAPG